MPLAHILTPLIAKKAQEIEADLGHSPSTSVGYLNSRAGAPPASGQNSRGPLLGKAYAPAQQPDPAARAANQQRITQKLQGLPDGIGTQVGMAASRFGAPQAQVAQVDVGNPLDVGRQQLAMEKVVAGAADTKAQAALAKQRAADSMVKSYATPFMNGVIKGQAMQAKREQHQGLIMPANPGPAPEGEPVAFDEAGRPIYEDRTPPPMPMVGPHRNQIMIMPEDRAQVIDEAGRQVDRRGRPTGYLAQPDQRDLQRAPVYRPSDIVLDNKRGGFLTQPNDFEVQSMREMYGQHLKAMQDNRGEGGRATDKFPAGYFQGMSKAQKANIEAGTKALMNIEKELDKGGGRFVTRT